MGFRLQEFSHGSMTSRATCWLFHRCSPPPPSHPFPRNPDGGGEWVVPPRGLSPFRAKTSWPRLFIAQSGSWQEEKADVREDRSLYMKSFNMWLDANSYISGYWCFDKSQSPDGLVVLLRTCTLTLVHVTACLLTIAMKCPAFATLALASYQKWDQKQKCSGIVPWVTESAP